MCDWTVTWEAVPRCDWCAARHAPEGEARAHPHGAAMEERLVAESARARETLARMRAAFDAELSAVRAENEKLKAQLNAPSSSGGAPDDGVLRVVREAQAERRFAHDRAAALVAYCRFQRARARNARRRHKNERRLRLRVSRALAMRRPQLLRLVTRHRAVCAELRALKSSAKPVHPSQVDAGADTGALEESRMAEMRRAVSTADSDRAALVAVSKELGETRAALADAHGQCERLATANHALERQLLHVRNAVDAASRSDPSDKLAADLLTAQRRISELEGALGRSRDDLSAAQTKVSELGGALDRCRDELTAAQRRASEAEKAQQPVAPSDERERTWAADRKALEAEVAAAVAVGNRASDSERRARERIDALEAERRDLTAKVHAAQAEIDMLRGECAAKGDAEKKLADATDEKHVLTVHLSRTGKELEETRAELRRTEERHGRVRAELDAAAGRIREAEETHRRLEKQTAHLSAKLDASESRHSVTQQLLSETTARLNETSAQLASAAEELEHARGDLASAQRDRASLLAAASRLSLVSHASDWSLSTATDSVRDAIRRRTCASLAHVRGLLDAGDRSMATLADLTAHCARLRRASAALLGLLRREHARAAALGRRNAQHETHIRSLEDELADAYDYVRVRIREDSLGAGRKDRRQMVSLLASEERILRRLRDRHAK